MPVISWGAGDEQPTFSTTVTAQAPHTALYLILGLLAAVVLFQAVE